MDCFKHQQRSPQIPPALFRNPLLQWLTRFVSLLLAYFREDSSDLVFCWRSDSHKQTTTSDRGDDVARAVRQQNQSQIWRVLLHGPTQGRLRISSEMVGFVDHAHLEALLGRQIHLLRLGDFFEQILDDDAIVVANVRRRDLEVVVGRDDVEFQLAIAIRLISGGVERTLPSCSCSPSRLEDPAVYLDLLHARPVQRPQGGSDSSLLAGSGRAIDQQMREVTACCQRSQAF